MIKIEIQAGQLQLNLQQGAERLFDLLDFASRQNPKRGFLFVSKVLGKHIPVKPSIMRSIYDELARACQLNGHALVMGLAETATGLGAGIADSLARLHPQHNIYYQHTTRHHLDAPLWFTLDEAHSHASVHLVYQPQPQLAADLLRCRHLILVDDEISTGKTMQQLVDALQKRLADLERITIISLVNWLPSRHHFDPNIEFIQLIKGQFDFKARPEFKPQLPSGLEQGINPLPCRDDLGRRGLLMPLHWPVPSLPADQLTVIGTGEHLYIPFLIAEAWENQGADILFQSTTRSPIMLGDAIQSKIQFQVHSGQLNFIYNLPADRPYHMVLENQEQAAENGFWQGQWQKFFYSPT